MGGNGHAFHNIFHPQRLNVSELVFDSSELEFMNLNLTCHQGKYCQIRWFVICHLQWISLLLFDSAQRFLLGLFDPLLFSVLLEALHPCAVHLAPDVARFAAIVWCRIARIGLRLEKICSV